MALDSQEVEEGQKKCDGLGLVVLYIHRIYYLKR